MKITALGEGAWLLQVDHLPVEQSVKLLTVLARRIRSQLQETGCEVVQAFDSLAVYFDACEKDSLGKSVRVRRLLETLSAVREEVVEDAECQTIEHVISVFYGGESGPDLEDVARHAGLTSDEVVKIHSEKVYTVGAVGFLPGFAYLVGLEKALHTPRRSRPRVRVEAGSVGIGGGQTGIYPTISPGGWNVIGRTSEVLWNPREQPPTRFQPGDRVRFQPVDQMSSPDVHFDESVVISRSDSDFVEVIRAGVQTSVQDLGRQGWQDVGLSRGGAMDALAAAVANLLVGNEENAAVLEFSLNGPLLSFGRDVIVAVTGSRIAGLPWGRPFAVKAGEVLDCGDLRTGARAWLAVSGGIVVPKVLDGAGTVLKSGFGGWKGRALRKGDRLPVGQQTSGGATSGTWWTSLGRATEEEREHAIRFVSGVQADWFSEETRHQFEASVYHVSAQSDRMGLRLQGAELARLEGHEMLSQPVVEGSIQVPPDGQPIVLMADRQTIGGYPQIGHVIRADLGRLSQFRPGEAVRFVQIDLAQALSLDQQMRNDLALLRTGLMCR